MATVTHSQAISGPGVSIQTLPVIRTQSGGISLEEPLSVARAGALTTRTTNNSGTLTMDAGHGITTGQTIAIFWGTGTVQYNVTVGTVSVNSVPISAGIGDNLPTAATNVTVSVIRAINLLIDGDLTDIIALVLETNDKSLRTAAHVQFRDSANAEIAELDLVANVPRVWDIAGGSANPFTGNIITNLRATQGNVLASETYTLKATGTQDASP